jgi:hypothetical protein
MITYKEGTKGPGDRKVYWNDIPVVFTDIAEIVNVLCKNEDIIYPKEKGYRGGQMLIDFLQEAYDNGLTDELKKRYRLGKYRP